MREEDQITIVYCKRCRWMMRAAWMGQELLSTFASGERDAISALTLKPGGPGIFEVYAGELLLWSREVEGRFPELKELKQRVRDQLAPQQPLGHSDARATDEEA